ncbi:MAG: CarD family transcriptional regulator [Atopobiaceae bacterium]|jgi:CarD family transcriptional regulator|nr:CarD family transcriptional regulator [Atopobiaceae bacterium]MCH4181068.1 CarD family transcriptional regulator [Atopobiaceae bacterium]MCH4213436.1 CarD family transcriptional regulator [Atopobiaceae bacterium]MCH4277073.1 CarD family transcriptional regulator [Atopobiaceae bacterium]MCI1226743.1 CarD family transcriptional regulator [Atopobiaceae bacterium]
MFSVGEYIVHPGQGVCKVEAVEDDPMAVYKLMPVRGRNPMLISFPVSNEQRLRPILSAEEATALIEDYPSMGLDEFRDKSNALEEEHFKSEIKRGSCRDSVRIVKTFRHRIDEVKANNKKPPVVYERILKEARERSLSELAVALEVTPEDVEQRFEQEEA